MVKVQPIKGYGGRISKFTSLTRRTQFALEQLFSFTANRGWYQIRMTNVKHLSKNDIQAFLQTFCIRKEHTSHKSSKSGEGNTEGWAGKTDTQKAWGAHQPTHILTCKTRTWEYYMQDMWVKWHVDMHSIQEWHHTRPQDIAATHTQKGEHGVYAKLTVKETEKQV